MSKINPVWHRMLYGCTKMATVGVKGLSFLANCRQTQTAVGWNLSRET